MSSCELTKDEILNIKRFSQQTTDGSFQTYDSCTYYDFMLQMLVNDFKNDLSNCIYRSECPSYDTMMIVMTVCYAYCLLKCCILFMVYFYQKNRVKNISNNISKIKNFDEDVQQQIQNNQNNQLQNSVQDNQERKSNTGKYYLDADSIEELKTYETSIKMNIYVEMFMAARDFFLFRGLGYFISYLYDVVFINPTIGNSISEQSFQCSIQSPNNITVNDCEYLKKNTYFYLSSADICVIRYPFFSLEGEDNVEQQYSLMYIYIILWIILESFAGSILFFNTQVLSYVNEGGKEPKDYNKKILNYSKIFFVCQAIVLSVLIFVFRIRLYFRFESAQVIIFYLVWKSLGFMLLLDQFIKKKYLSKELYIDIAYDKDMDWTKNEKNNYEKAKERAEQSLDKMGRSFIENYKHYLQIIHKNLESKCAQKQSQQKNKIKFQWNSYLMFVLCTLGLGIIGYSLCLIHYSINKDSSQQDIPNTIELSDLNTSNFLFGKYLKAQGLYWFGFVFCMLESAIFEIFNSVLLLHSYYLQLFKQMASPEGEQSSNEEQEIQ
ncbi:transmembrane protein, putative (macronuclear) [Tetrahymena thermophila SB210]|uniref:Transmembrane protein, putative n=1 Tax=Tetrahymena thermophila (strain SB210) TaxID=312017 RepID=Q233B0_TETTS|nr:transmembrane protein, putative [Tetrahymena thermophila SB210]EAR91670.1 transmembrane protein, putative [Tetrahymena thermophila SB210]|eukprot:XP_001011915.1 transmembrane protein, putative [Tetrahymena thermophila SB210]